MRLRFGFVLGVLFCLTVVVESQARSDVKVIDGDSLFVGKIEVRLEGIDAPEYKQKCFDKNGDEYACGLKALNYMKQLVSQGEVACRKISIDRYKRQISVCYVNGKDINQAMVAAGWAVAYDRYDASYVDDEQKAREEKLGIWQGKFMKPEIWRALHRRR